jgi:DNA polymerase, archaea type
MKSKFIPINYDYFDFNEKNYAKIYGRDEKGKNICVIDSFEPYFWAILKPELSKNEINKLIEKIKNIKIDSKIRKIEIKKIELETKNFLGKEVNALKIFSTNYKDLHEIASNLGIKEIDKRRGYDLGYITTYIIEKKLEPLNWYEIEGEILHDSKEFGGIDNILETDFVIKLKNKTKLKEQEFKPKILAYDIETDSLKPENGEILMISLKGEKFEKVISWKKSKTNLKYVEFVKDEKELLEKFTEHVKKISPDFLVGYNSDSFDMSFIKHRAKILKTKLPLSLDGSEPKISRGISTSARLSGITHIDLIKFIRTTYSQYMQSETLSLNEVSKEFLGDSKKDFKIEHSSKLKESHWEKYYEYNLHDSVLTYKLFEKFWPDLLEFSKIIKEPLFEISRNGLSKQIESYILHHLEKYNEIAEKRPGLAEIENRRTMGGVEGAFVYEPKPGIYENLVMFDFTSMHTSIIISHNISKGTLTTNEKNSYASPEIEIQGKEKKFYFTKKPGFFPLLLKDIFEKRKKYKKEYQKNPNTITKARSNAFKLLSASAHGYVGFFGARYYSWESSASILAFVRKYNKETIKKIENKNYQVIFGDSVSGDTKIWIKEKEKIKEIEIEKLFKKVDTKTSSGKEYNLLNNIKTLTIDKNGKSVFKPIPYILRHKTKKQMYRINFTNNWHIDVTEDHSLIGYQSNKFNQSKKIKPLERLIELKPTEIRKKANSIISIKKIPLKKTKSLNYPKEVYEFLGLFIGDGSFAQNKAQKKANKDYCLSLSLGLDKKELIEKLILPLQKKNYIKNYWESKTRIGDIKFNGLKLINIIKKHCKNKKNKKSFPSFLFEEKEENIASFLRGYFTADGTVIKRDNGQIIKLTSINQQFINESIKLLNRVGISNSSFKENNPNFYKTKNQTYSNNSISKHILIKNKENFMEKIGFILSRKNTRGLIKTKGQQKKLIKEFEFDLQNVKSIEKIPSQKYVYDLEVEDTHRFFANNCLVHNTDSVAFTREGKSKKEIKELLIELNETLPGVMNLELEDFFKRGIWVTTRAGTTGAKKKYAMIDEHDNIKIRGFETVRRDWCKLARTTQNKIIKLILKEGNEVKALEFLKEIITKLKSRQIDKSDLIIRSQLKKPLESYKAISPHVTAAQKMKSLGTPLTIGSLIEYYIGESNTKSKLVRDKVKLPEEKTNYDIKYYLEKQIIPSAENIFQIFGINLKEIIEGKKQENLGKWF